MSVTLEIVVSKVSYTIHHFNLIVNIVIIDLLASTSLNVKIEDNNIIRVCLKHI